MSNLQEQQGHKVLYKKEIFTIATEEAGTQHFRREGCEQQEGTVCIVSAFLVSGNALLPSFLGLHIDLVRIGLSPRACLLPKSSL